jgi:hypothetical protein
MMRTASGLRQHHHELLIRHRVAKRNGTTDPDALALGRCDLVPHSLPNQLPLKLCLHLCLVPVANLDDLFDRLVGAADQRRG